MGKNLQEWLANRYHGEMHYMANHQTQRIDPRMLVPGAKSVIVVAMNYYTSQPAVLQEGTGRISRYAWGLDYHDVLRHRMKQLLAQIQLLAPGTAGRVFVDSAPVLEKVWAERAGIGWQGKNSLIISPQLGSWIFLGELIVDLELSADAPDKNRCGTCRRCIDACPTGALVAPGVLDARRCLSYLTIELKSQHAIPQELAGKMNGYVFGCDICQEVCLWNFSWSTDAHETSFHPLPGRTGTPLREYAELTEDEFRRWFAKSPVKRVKYAGFMRNVHTALGE